MESLQKESPAKIRKLIDDLSKDTRSLEMLEQKTENWDTLLIFMITSKLDSWTLREWERHIADSSELPEI